MMLVSGQKNFPKLLGLCLIGHNQVNCPPQEISSTEVLEKFYSTFYKE
jgi:hypothetical protein